MISLKSQRPHKIFVGANALKHAIYFGQYRRNIRNTNDIFDYNPVILRCIQYSINNPTAMNVTGTNIEGRGNHAKLYETKDSIIFSSQNNGNSPLFEFAIQYDKRTTGKLESFFTEAIRECSSHRRKYEQLNANTYRRNIRG